MNSPKKNILFITWDSGETSYVENLYIPLFQEIESKSRYKFFILQFTWASSFKIKERQNIAQNAGISFVAIHFKNSSFHKLKILLNSNRLLQKHIQNFDIDFLMPRSYLPAYICLQSNSKLPIIYDADGLPFLEKKEVGKPWWLLQFISAVESKIIQKSKQVITRQEFAIEYFSNKYKLSSAKKFSAIANGASDFSFFYDEDLRVKKRKELGLNETDLCLIYIGSIGSKYGFDEMIAHFSNIQKDYKDSILIILSAFENQIKPSIPNHLKSSIRVRNVPHNEVNSYLNAADAGFCLLQPTKSMKAVSPVKVNEYLLTGLPVILNKFNENLHGLKIGKNSFIIPFRPNDKPISWSHIRKEFQILDRNKIMLDARKTVSAKSIANAYICTLDRI